MTEVDHQSAAPASGLTPLMRSVRDQNVGALLRQLVRGGPTARKRLGVETRLSPTTVTRLTGQLIESGVLAELEPRARPHAEGASRAGRPETPLGFTGSGRLVAGCHLHAGSATASLFDLDGAAVTTVEVPFVGGTAESALGAGHEALAQLVATQPRGVVLGIGVATGGVVDSERGVLVHNPQTGWQDVDIRAALTPLGLPMVIDDSVRALAVNQFWTDPAPLANMADMANTPDEPRTVLTVFVSNTVGAALLIDGRLHRGPGSLAGDIQHFPTRAELGLACSCGRVDCLGVVVTNQSLHQRGVTLGVLDPEANWSSSVLESTAAEMVEMRLERAVILGEAIAAMATFLDPGLTVVAGHLGPAEDVEACLAAARERISVAGWDRTGPRVSYRETPADVWDKASAALVVDDFLRTPTTYVPELLG